MQLFNFHGLDAVSFVTIGFGQNEDFSATIFLIGGSGGRREQENGKKEKVTFIKYLTMSQALYQRLCVSYQTLQTP